jgi:outer membrane receptor protein involved in Fe transport
MILVSYASTALREPACAMLLLSLNSSGQYEKAVALGAKYVADYPADTTGWRAKTLYVLADGLYYDHKFNEADAYYQRFEKLIGTRATTNMLGQMFVYPANIDGADSWGAELQLTYKDKSKALSAWYSYNGFKCDTPAQDLQAFLPSPHKAGLTGRLFLSDDWVINSQYRFADTTLGNPANGRSFASSNRLDLTISKSFARDKCEIMIGVQDIFDKTHAPIAESFQFTGHEIPGRTFFVRLQFSF